MRDLRTQRIVVTGGAGFLGTQVIARLKQRGAKFVFVPRSAEYDLREKKFCRRLLSEIKPHIVIHLAAVGGGIGANLARPANFFYDNAIMGLQLMECARKAGVEKFVSIGTVCSYPKLTPKPFREEALWDGYPESTNAAYGLAKKMTLVQGQAYREQYGFNAIYLMPVNLYGPGDNFDRESSHVVPALIRKCVEAVELQLPEIEIWGDGTPTREFLYVDDAAEAVVLATEKFDGADPVNVGSGVEISIVELVERIAHLTGFKGSFRWDLSRPNGQPRRLVDTTRAVSAFGFRATTPLDTGLSRTIRWYRRHAETSQETSASKERPVTSDFPARQ